jgi:hypothetical protein
LILQIDAEPTRYKFSWGPVPSARAEAATVTVLAPLREAETRLLATEVTGGFTGTVAGLYVRTNNKHRNPASAAFDWFDYEPKQ